MNLREFARAVGLSVSTVSRALNGYDDVNEETRRRVVAAAEQLGYSPDPAARRLRRGSSDMIGFVLSPPQKHFANPFFLDLMMGIEERLRETPFQLVITTAKSTSDELSSFRRLVEQQRVDGIIFARTRRHDERVSYLQKRGIAFATLGRSESERPFPWVDIDHTIVGRDGCGRFIALGHKRIALLNTPSYLMYSHHRRAGYEAALVAADLPLDPDLIVEEDLTEEGGLAGARRLLALADPPTAILCGHDLVAMGAIQAISQAGKLAGREIGVIGSDNNPMGTFTNPPLTTFSAPTLAAGRRLAELLLARLDGQPAETLQEVWSPELIIRSSDGPPRHSEERRENRRSAAR